MFLDAVERSNAVSRLEFTADMGAVAGGIFGKNDKINNHIDSLRKLANGE
jgi:hypothetical protein